MSLIIAQIMGEMEGDSFMKSTLHPPAPSHLNQIAHTSLQLSKITLVYLIRYMLLICPNSTIQKSKTCHNIWEQSPAFLHL